jgi:hypothetical protein
MIFFAASGVYEPHGPIETKITFHGVKMMKHWNMPTLQYSDWGTASDRNQ